MSRVSLAGVARPGGPLTQKDLRFLERAAQLLAARPGRPPVMLLRLESFALAAVSTDAVSADRQDGGRQPHAAVEAFRPPGVAAGEALRPPVVAVDADPVGREWPGPADGGPGPFLAQLYAQKGPEALEQMRGAFAGLVWDPTRRQLVLFRDPLGLRPLFYTQPPGGGALAFSSQMAPLLQYPGLDRRPNFEAVAESVVFGFLVTPGWTPLQHVHQVLPGALLEFSRAGLGRAGELPLPGAPGVVDPEAVLNALRLAVSRAGGGQPGTAVLLSGGLDSSLVAATAAALSAAPGTAYTLADRTPESCNLEDVQAARRVAADLGWDRIEVPFDSDVWLGLLADTVLANETFWPGSAFALGGDAELFALGAAAAQALPPHSCLLTGDGGDELFGGYWMHRFPLGFVDRLRERAAGLGPGMKSMVDRCFPLPEDRETYRQRVWSLLLGPGLHNCHLWCADRTARWWGLPLQTPYLDEGLVALARAVPPRSHLEGDAGKAMLRPLARRVLPPASADIVARRRKLGISAAIPGTLRRLETALERLIPPDRRLHHPCAKPLAASPLDLLTYDLWYALFVAFRGKKPEGFSACTLYSDFPQALPREGPAL